MYSSGGSTGWQIISRSDRSSCRTGTHDDAFTNGANGGRRPGGAASYLLVYPLLRRGQAAFSIAYEEKGGD
jgi:hypothetical protein